MSFRSVIVRTIWRRTRTSRPASMVQNWRWPSWWRRRGGSTEESNCISKIYKKWLWTPGRGQCIRCSILSTRAFSVTALKRCSCHQFEHLEIQVNVQHNYVTSDTFISTQVNCQVYIVTSLLWRIFIIYFFTLKAANHYGIINLPEAWDLQAGTSSVVVQLSTWVFF